MAQNYTEEMKAGRIETNIQEHSTSVGLDSGIQTPSADPNSKQENVTEDGSLKAFTIWFAVTLPAMLVWLDERIVATAIPSISDRFNSLKDVGWYGSAYLFALCASQMSYGKFYKYFPIKNCYLTCLLIFEVGSIVQATSPSSPVFIIGRVLAGLGGAGVITGMLVVYSNLLPRKLVPLAYGSIGCVSAVGSIAGPILGGVISKSKLTWRWCFYINPIISSVTLIPLLIFLKTPKDSEERSTRFSEKIARQDWLGTLLFAAGIVSLLLALQYGSTDYSWSNWRTIVLFVAAVVGAVSFGILQAFRQEMGLIPPRLLKRRVVLCCMFYMFFFDAAYFLLQYYLPLWFQAIKGLSPEQSAFHTLPFMIMVVISIFTSGLIIGRVRTLQPSMTAASILLTLGSGLLTMIKPTSPNAQWVIFQMLVGIGSGAGTQLPILAVSDELDKTDVPTGISLVLTSAYLGGSVSVTVAEVVLSSRFGNCLNKDLPDIDVDLVKTSGATNLGQFVTQAQLPGVVRCYSEAVTATFYVATVVAGITLFGVATMRWRKMSKTKESPQEQEKSSEPSP